MSKREVVQNFHKILKSLNIINIFGITIENAFEWVQTCLVLVKEFMKFWEFLERNKTIFHGGKTNGRVESGQTLLIADEACPAVHQGKA